MKWTNKEQIGGAHWVYDMDTESWVASVASDHVALVTAAPELLAACKESLRLFEEGVRLHSYETVDGALRAAIAKATSNDSEVRL